MGLQRLGFGFIEAGTVTPRPQPGNPRPRLFRLEQDLAIINRMGFNNAGLDAFVRRLQALRLHVPVGANVGANKDSADRIADFVEGLHRVWPHADYVSINVSSPNTPGLRGLQEPGQLQDLLGRLAEARAIRLDEHGDRPVFLKVAPDLDEAAIAAIAELSLANGVSGLIVSNTTLERPDSLSSAARGESGGLSGRPLFVRSTTVLRAFAQCLGGRLPLIGVGGVEDGKTALEKIKAGASAVQIYSALIYGGPGLPRKIAKDLAARLKAEGFGAVKDAVGAG
jgi:dihydroorotate dehydrogenase